MSQMLYITIHHLTSGDVGLLKGLLAMFGDAFEDRVSMITETGPLIFAQKGPR